MIKLVDCTLRDGGYFTNWNFDKKFARSLIGSLSKAGVDIIEVGYKSPKTHKADNFEGLFRYCNNAQIEKLSPRSNYAFMIDAKEWTPELIPETIPDDKMFKWVRVDAYLKDIDKCVSLVRAIRKNLDINVTLNLMGISTIPVPQLAETLNVVNDIQPDVFYFSDSFGDITPQQVKSMVPLIRSKFNGDIGIHTHDSNGLAFANTIEAINSGVTFVDGTLTGMGRGAGNLRTEQILLYLFFKEGYSHLNPSELLEVIDTYMLPMRDKYKWGWDYSYMLSAMQSIHPTYCMNLRASNQYTIEQISSILNTIPQSSRESYNESELRKSIDIAINQPLTTNHLYTLPIYKPSSSDTVLVIATGPSKLEFKDEILDFIKLHNPFVIECNPQDDTFMSSKYIGTILNWSRLNKFYMSSPVPLLTGIQSLPTAANVNSIPCHIDKNISINNDKITIPSYVVGMYSICVAVLMHPKTIFLAGFDGYDIKDPKNDEMVYFFNQIVPMEPIDIVSITPTTYPVKVSSIFKYI
jgi:4-hydroxy 2-oxovalerate aldolase